MQQNKLAALLGISPAMVSRLKKKGMPTDTAERAEKWRRRHLEPSRIKGTRFDPTQATGRTTRNPVSASNILLGVSVAGVEAAGAELDYALVTGDEFMVDEMLQQLRHSLRQMGLETDPNDEAEPRLSMRVWWTLCAYVLKFDAMMQRETNPNELLTPVQFCGRWRSDKPTYPLQNHHTLSHACDWNDYSIKGWPKYPDDDKWDAMAAEAGS